jgi:uridine phosphorylase
MNFKESELIVNKRGAVYHLNLRPDELAQNVILVGDPGRVGEVSQYFDRIEIKTGNREFITHTGSIGNTRISCISTGIGTDNIDIVLNELDALVNIDLQTRDEKEQKTSLRLLRLGTTGALQPDIKVDSFIASAYVIGLDGVLNYYKYQKSIEQLELISDFVQQVSYPHELAKPYAFKASEKMLSMFTDQCRQGITLTAPGFYAPQGRKLRFELMFPELIDNYSKFRYLGNAATNLEMETSALYGIGTLLGHHVCTLCAVVANRINKTFSADGHKAVDELIKYSLQKIIQNPI